MRRTALAAACLAVMILGAALLWRPAAEADNQFEPLKRFSQVLDMVERYYVRDVTRRELIDGAVRGMLQELDPHSMYMEPEEFEDLQVNTQGEFSGIGIEISMQNGRLTVVSPIEDTPAYEAGLKSGDIILEIEGESTQDITLLGAVKKIRGPKGTSVELTILHKGDKAPVKVSIVRDTIPIISVKNEELDKGYLYLRVTRFNEHTTEELHETLEKYRKKRDNTRGIVLDLRNNPGGLLDQAVSVADTFVESGKIVYIQGKDPATRKDFIAREQPTDVEAPLVVLINVGSASASEIVAGAMQDLRRGLVIGEQTFGKGSVQTIIPLTDGAGVKLTTALYYTPNGRSIQAEGIEPDLYIPRIMASVSEEEEKDSLFIMRERDLSRHLEQTDNGDGEGAVFEPTEKVVDMLDKDNQLRIALQLVKRLPTIQSLQ